MNEDNTNNNLEANNSNNSNNLNNLNNNNNIEDNNNNLENINNINNSINNNNIANNNNIGDNQATDFTPFLSNIFPVDNSGRRIIPDNYFRGSEFNHSRSREERRRRRITEERINLHRLINQRSRNTELEFLTQHQLTGQDRFTLERSALGLFDTDGREAISGDRNVCLNILINARDFPVFRIYNSTTHQWESFAFPDPQDDRIPEEARVVLRALFQSFRINHLVNHHRNN